MGLLRRRSVAVIAVTVAVAMIVTGGVLAYLGYHHDDGPAGAVRSYFHALTDDDAPRALAWGTVPDGPHTLLTTAVLREQQRIAPIREFRTTHTTRTSSRATVHVTYSLGFTGRSVPVSADVDVLERNGAWRLAAAAVSTQLVLDSAGQRAKVLSGPVSAGSVLLFPGAVPVTFDSPYLELAAAGSTIGFGSQPETDISAEVSPAGRRAVTTAVDGMLAACVRAPADVACPLPDTSYVPGSLRGRVKDPDYMIVLESSSAGLIDITAQASFTGSYRHLSFTNLASNGTGPLTLDVHAQAYATTPLAVTWVNS